MLRNTLTALLIASPLLALAQTDTPRVDERQARQEQRIDQGVANGSLTAQEAQRLDRQQARVNTLENRVKADGQITPRERAALHGAQNHSSRTIARKKHNGRGG
jgi:hypothetical protein